VYRNIIVGYDGSDEARDALALAGVLRDREGVVTAVCSPSNAPGASAERTLARLGEGGATAPWLQTRRLAASEGAEGLLHVVQETGADLFALGSSHRSEAGRTLTGPVGRRLLAGCRTPVAVAPKGYRGRTSDPSVVTIAFEAQGEAASAVPEGVRLAQSLGAGLQLLCVVPPLPRWALDAGVEAGYSRGDVEQHHLSSFGHLLEGAMAFVPAGMVAEGRLLEGRPAAVLLRELKRGVDLLVMASPGVRPVAGVRPGATAIGVMRSCPCPVLLTPTGVRTISARPHAATR
jgi:nucleotide-binding universal stress UspA family protein